MKALLLLIIILSENTHSSFPPPTHTNTHTHAYTHTLKHTYAHTQDYPSTGIDPGESEHLHYTDLDSEPELSAMVVRVCDLEQSHVFSVHTICSTYIVYYVLKC